MSDVIAAMSDVSSWDEVSEHVTLVEKILACPAQYKDFITGEVISQDRILHICKTLDNQQKLFEEGRAIYSQVKHTTQGSEEVKKWAARKASAAHAGGKYTRVWDRLHDDKIAISILVTAPPAATKDIADENEKRLLILIHQCDQTLKGWWQDIWTSKEEIGTVSQTYIYVRYPWWMGEQLQKLCHVLNTISVQTHKFSARVGQGQALELGC